MASDKLERDVKFLKLYAAGTTAMIAALGLSAFAPGGQKMQELTVERLNVVEPDGELVMVVANSKNVPDPMVEGEVLEGARQGFAPGGMIFYNGKGTEVGGLVFGLQKGEGDNFFASQGLFLDAYLNDQTVKLDYIGTPDGDQAGLTIIDRARDYPLLRVNEMMQEFQAAEGAEKLQLQEEFQKAGPIRAQRLRMGSYQKTALVELSDTNGKPRLRLSVRPETDEGMIEFLDADGNVTHTFPE